ncbi:hypothetical protein BJY21_001543 [Kineosphaera limosa]|uniref:DUF3592 domain-containing protein n=1 Tax=Kineosphaera limosa NBRC 100340 TaxID=1184609 RepID=K6WY15_9MICO|nr:hypothetical protein [Kineosphaera limosa]NYE00359.1 hypothetical protein [Kineosphaera limosa]GAB96997.1 hypothetical protein KILIM_054_00070 [Kineosphaera limosa NBRC 100340]
MKSRARSHTDALSSPSRLVGTLAFKVIALVVAASVAILLWQFALRIAGYAIANGGKPTTSATVVECSRTLGVSGACVVEFTAADGGRESAELSTPGLFSLSPGNEVEVVALEPGKAGMGGWSPLFDAGLLVLLAVAFTTYAIGWWRRVLEHDAPGYNGGDPDPSDPFYEEPGRR